MTDAFDDLATQLHLELFAAFVTALGPEERYTPEEPDGVAAVKDAGGDLHELRRDTLRVVAAQLERLRPAEDADRGAAQAVRADWDADRGQCEDCFCCTAAGCRNGPGGPIGRRCPSNDSGESVCPCTGD